MLGTSWMRLFAVLVPCEGGAASGSHSGVMPVHKVGFRYGFGETVNYETV